MVEQSQQVFIHIVFFLISNVLLHQFTCSTVTVAQLGGAVTFPVLPVLSHYDESVSFPPVCVQA